MTKSQKKALDDLQREQKQTFAAQIEQLKKALQDENQREEDRRLKAEAQERDAANKYVRVGHICRGADPRLHITFTVKRAHCAYDNYWQVRYVVNLMPWWAMIPYEPEPQVGWW